MEKSKKQKMLKYFGVLLSFFILMYVVMFFILVIVFNFLYEVIDKTFISGSITDMQPLEISFSSLTSLSILSTFSIFYLGLPLLTLIIAIYLTFKFHTNYGNLNKNQKGSSRFATLKEIQSQYREVPDKAKRFEGTGGVPVARYKDKLYIDDSKVNNLIIGTTRSGKGETLVFSTIDIYSRAKEQASMVINDPKGELFSASKETLEGLGYNVEVFNLLSPEQSMSYNLLKQTVDSFMSGDIELAEKHARSIGFMLFNDPNAKDPVWWKSSASLTTALILALCEQCKEEPEKITMYNVALMLSDLGSREVYNEEQEEKINALDDFFLKFPTNHPARLQFSTVNFSSGQMRASILANTNSELDIFTVRGVGKLTSQTSFDTRKLGFKKWFSGKTKPNTRITVTFNDGSTETTRTNADGIFSIYHTKTTKIKDELKFKVDDIEGTITIDSLLEKNKGLYKAVSNNDKLEITEFVIYDKPTAIFMVTPDYDATFNSIVSIFVKQVYTDMSRIASSIKGQKCQRELIFILDEFGNMPTIEDFTNIITVCLGRQIKFNLVIQAYSQLEQKYGDGWKTIDGNCGNTLYLLTADEDTAERISKKLGNKTIVVKSRTGQPVSLSKSKTESVDSERLLPSADVMALEEGEMIVIRVIKRQDKERKSIRSYPIYLNGETKLKYRYQYLSDYYDTSRSINDYDIECLHADLNLDNFAVEFLEHNYTLRKEQEEKKQQEQMKEQNEKQDEQEENNDSSKKEEDSKENHTIPKKEYSEFERKLKEQKKQNLRSKFIEKKIDKEFKVIDVVGIGILENLYNNDIKVEEVKNMGLVKYKNILISTHENEEFKDKHNFIQEILTQIDSKIVDFKKNMKEISNQKEGKEVSNDK